MLNCQKSLFQLPDEIHYMNNAFMSPFMKQVEDAGILAIQKRRNPSVFKSSDYFTITEPLRQYFGNIIHSDPKHIAIIPSAAYGLQNAVSNLPIDNGDHAISVTGEFPSDLYTIQKWCDKHSKKLNIISPPQEFEDRGKKWNAGVLESINDDTAVVIMSSIHWQDGTKFDLKAIGQKCKSHKAMFIVDGTQSVGVLPIDVHECQIDALICAGYKWLLGPYSLGLAYYSDFFDTGIPMEESWMNKINAQNFAQLTADDEYAIGAQRYNMGESSQFIQAPMLAQSLGQIVEWNPVHIQEYCRQLMQPLIPVIKSKGLWIEDESYRTNHLFGILDPEQNNSEQIFEGFQKNKIFTSLRGRVVRISCYLYNTEQDIEILCKTISNL